MRSKSFRFIKTKWFIALSCLMLGAIIVLGIRFAAYKPDEVHYHANFALYMNGKQEEFKNKRYYTPGEMCSAEAIMTPSERAHMHDNVNNVIHVEHDATTWGHFFTNLGWYLGPRFIQSPDRTLFTESDTNKLHIILNGQDYTDFGEGVTNTVISDTDKLLVSYGDQSETEIQRQYKSIPSTAHKYDLAQDPESCGGHSGASLSERFKHML
jgi:hypothetical protein